MDMKEILCAGDKCIQEEPAFCTNQCPVHVDVRFLMAKVQQGDFTGAFKHYQKQVMFPGIISRICPAPCQEACLRSQLDHPLSIRLIEKACVDFTKTSAVNRFAIPRKKKQVCIVGGGLSGLSCGLNLSRKGYQVKLLEQSGRLGGKLWQMSPEMLPPEIISQELDLVRNDEDLEIFLHTKVDQLDGLEGDAFFVATGREGDPFDLINAEDHRVSFHPLTLESSQKGVFVGGSLLATEGEDSAINSIAQGLRAARSIERYLKNASLTEGREGEVYQKTRLHTNLPHQEPKPAVLPARPGAGYTKEEAGEEAGRCLLCECKSCVRACQLLERYREYPKKYITNIQQSLHLFEVVAGRFINSCNLCGLCKEVCPTDLDMSEICLSSRRILHRGGKLPPAFHDFWLRDMQFSGGEKAFLSLNPPGRENSSYLFFPGCQLGASRPEYVIKAYQYLSTRLPNGVALTLGCCGAPAAWAGREELHHQVIQAVQTSWEKLGKPTVILACPTCLKMFQQYLPELKAVTLWNVIKEYGLPEETARGNGITVTVYDSCSSRYDPATQESIRQLLGQADYHIAELPYHGKYAQCCSYGGLIYSANPTLAQEIIKKRTEASPYHYVTYCTNCRDTFAADGKAAWHMLDLLFGSGSEHEAKRKPPSLSQRWENRITLKKQLLKEIWGVDVTMDQRDHERIALLVPAEVQEKMDRELILLDDVKGVIHYAESTGNRLFDTKRKHFISYLPKGIITYWVEYLPKEDSYEIMNVYSHRIRIGEGER
ncbi:pyridine nucleotide-disulfide oxidoreductase/dicluster-binding protein [Candidatus Formimonas warabiya]|uniref:4Fe-4S ferredoxin-type domain-containing protein n=1 Tax=Formimonas warabiya TaxID=1761012 RepID=A0A3G1KTI1_FORW1|nr:pyridine nucleotide-disulfide oxidoreductase/dicluster-binding protein [Candidatus Formimonas warabiya]ATW25740.1 hypothetical protein DCMF_14085 [Candidatus Formimonas warabiya]